MMMITGDAIALYRMNVLLKGLKLELLGMKRKGRSCLSIIKQEYGLKGNARSVYQQFGDYVAACTQASSKTE